MLTAAPPKMMTIKLLPIPQKDILKPYFNLEFSCSEI